ncbi:MAG: hypothetical protein Q7S21_01115 [archaeon]|nr:hypothetical protein [archaeon]
MVLFFVLIIALIIAEQECIQVVPDPQDEDGEIGCITKWPMGGGGAGNITVTITSPTNNPTYTTTFPVIVLGGNATDNQSVVSVTWTNDRGGNGGSALSNPGAATTNFTTSVISLQQGVNILTVTAKDNQNNTATDQITVTYTPNPPTIDLAPHPNSEEQLWIEPIQTTKYAPFLVANKNVIARTFIDLKNNQGQVELGLNTFDKPWVAIEVKIDTGDFYTHTEIEIVRFYNWYDYSVDNPFTSNKIRTYAFTGGDFQQEKFLSYINDPNLTNDQKLGKVREMVHSEGIDAVDVSGPSSTYFFRVPSVSSVDVSGRIDILNVINEIDETNNAPAAIWYAVRKLKDKLSFKTYFAAYGPKKQGFQKNKDQLLDKVITQGLFLISAYPLPDNKDFYSNFLFGTRDLDLSQICGIQASPTALEIRQCLAVLNFRIGETGKEQHNLYFVPHDFLDSASSQGYAFVDGRGAFVEETSVYFTSAHEMAHQFGLLEQYLNSNKSVIEKSWYLDQTDVDAANDSPYGFISKDGWASYDYLVNRKDPDVPQTIKRFTPKTNVKPFDKRADAEFNYYSFMGGKPLLPKDSTDYYGRWTDRVVSNRLFFALLEPISGQQKLSNIAGNVISISGIIFDQNNDTTLDPFFQWEGIPFDNFDGNSLSDENFFVEILDENMQSVLLHRFIPNMFTLDDQNVFSFAAVVSFPQGSSKILIKRNALVIGERVVSSNTPTININKVNIVENDFFQVDWSAFDIDGNSLFYSIEYSPDGINFEPVSLSHDYDGSVFDFNASQFTGSDFGFLRFQVSDGINTASNDTLPFVVSNKPPNAFISFPEDDSNFSLGQLITFGGIGYDLEEGFLPDSSFFWNSDLNGFLGIGQDFNRSDLNVVGVHIITLTVTDSNGLQATDSIDLNITN